LNRAVALYLEDDDAIVRVQNGCLRADQFLDGGGVPLRILWQSD
jgi:hypothetical protein